MSFFILSEDLAGGSWTEVEKKIKNALPIKYAKSQLNGVSILDDFSELFWMIGYYGWDNVIVFKDVDNNYYVYIDGGGV